MSEYKIVVVTEEGGETNFYLDVEEEMLMFLAENPEFLLGENKIVNIFSLDRFGKTVPYELVFEDFVMKLVPAKKKEGVKNE